MTSASLAFALLQLSLLVLFYRWRSRYRCWSCHSGLRLLHLSADFNFSVYDDSDRAVAAAMKTTRTSAATISPQSAVRYVVCLLCCLTLANCWILPVVVATEAAVVTLVAARGRRQRDDKLTQRSPIRLKQ